MINSSTKRYRNKTKQVVELYKNGFLTENEFKKYISGLFCDFVDYKLEKDLKNLTKSFYKMDSRSYL